MEGHPGNFIKSLKTVQRVKLKLQGRVKVLGLIDQLSAQPSLGDMHKPNFVYLVEGNPEEIISYKPCLL